MILPFSKLFKIPYGDQEYLKQILIDLMEILLDEDKVVITNRENQILDYIKDISLHFSKNQLEETLSDYLNYIEIMNEVVLKESDKSIREKIPNFNLSMVYKELINRDINKEYLQEAKTRGIFLDQINLNDFFKLVNVDKPVLKKENLF